MRVEVTDQGSHDRLLLLVVFERFWQCSKQLFMSKMKWFFSLALRILAFGATVSAAIVMGTSRQTASFFSVSFEAKYSDIPSFKYFVIMEAIASIYCFLVIFLHAKSFLWRFIVIADLIFAMLLTSSIAAALAVAQVGKYGNSHAGWLPICGQVPQYCHHVTGALGAGFAAVVIFLVILLSTIYTFLNPPLV